MIIAKHYDDVSFISIPNSQEKEILENGTINGIYIIPTDAEEEEARVKYGSPFNPVVKWFPEWTFILIKDGKAYEMVSDFDRNTRFSWVEFEECPLEDDE